MRHLSKAILGAGLLALAACGGRGDDAAGDNIADAAENQADVIDEMADNTANDVQAEALENQADAVREAGEAKEEAVDEADVTVNQ